MLYGPSPLNKEDIEKLKLRFKFNDSILQLLNKKYKKELNFKKTFRKISKLLKPSISNETIELFYSDPKNFFENNLTLLNNTSYFDESGKIINDAMDREGRLFKVHPTTKVPFVGFQIPYYKEAIEMCIEASKVIPEVAFVGFDIAISENGPVIVEGNELPGYDVYQSRIHNKDNRNGLKPYFDKVVYGSEEDE